VFYGGRVCHCCTFCINLLPKGSFFSGNRKMLVLTPYFFSKTSFGASREVNFPNHGVATATANFAREQIKLHSKATPRAHLLFAFRTLNEAKAVWDLFAAFHTRGRCLCVVLTKKDFALSRLWRPLHSCPSRHRNLLQSFRRSYEINGSLFVLFSIFRKPKNDIQ
jgi:hypothetical protein